MLYNDLTSKVTEISLKEAYTSLIHENMPFCNSTCNAIF